MIVFVISLFVAVILPGMGIKLKGKKENQEKENTFKIQTYKLF